MFGSKIVSVAGLSMASNSRSCHVLVHAHRDPRRPRLYDAKTGPLFVLAHRKGDLVRAELHGEGDRLAPFEHGKRAGHVCDLHHPGLGIARIQRIHRRGAAQPVAEVQRLAHMDRLREMLAQRRLGLEEAAAQRQRDDKPRKHATEHGSSL